MCPGPGSLEEAETIGDNIWTRAQNIGRPNIGREYWYWQLNTNINIWLRDKRGPTANIWPRHPAGILGGSNINISDRGEGYWHM